MILSDIAIRNRTTVAVIVVLIIILGLYSYFTLPREAAPDVPVPIVLVTTAYEGVSPEDVESAVTLKIEKELTGLKGLKEIRSSSAEGISFIVIEFQPDIIIEDALQYVRARIDLVKPELPDEAEEPSIKEINIAEFPIMLVSISGDLSAVRMKAIADDLEREIESVYGVLNVDVLGALEREIRIEIDPDRLALYDLTLPEMVALIPAENVNVSAGGLETAGTRFYVRVPGEFVDPAEVQNLLLTVRNGRPIYLTDVATIRDAFKDRASFSRLDGRNSITVSIQKRVGANVVSIADTIRGIVAAAAPQAPRGVKFDVIFDMSKDIREMVKDLENNIISGLILVVLVLVLFMGWRSSVIVSLAIPLSMLISFAVIQAFGYTLNMIVLFSLILALGMLVDNAIVIVENIYRHMQLGHDRVHAAILGAREVAWPIITSTLTTVAAFFPMAFWPGIMGDFMKYLPMTLMITLLSSLFVALVVNPTVCAVFGGRGTIKPPADSAFKRGYRRMLVLALHHRFAVLYMAVLLLVAVVLLYAVLGKGVEFFPQTDPNRAVVDIRSPQGTNVNESDRLALIVEGRLKPWADTMDHVVANVGSGAILGDPFAGAAGEHTAGITMIFHDYEVRERPSDDVIAEIRGSLEDIPGAEIKVEKERDGPPTGAPVTVRIVGKDLDVLRDLSRKAYDSILGVAGLVNLRSDLEATRPELIFRVDRSRAALQHVDSNTIGQFLKMAVFGREVSTFREYNEEYDITLRLPESQRVNIEDLLRLSIPNQLGRAVPLSSLGEFDYRGGYGTINRVDQKRVVTLTADVEGRLGPAVLKDVKDIMAKLDKPVGYEIRYAGEDEEKEKAQAFLGKAFGIAVLLIVLILVAQFNSLIVPIIIMSTVALSTAGVLLGLLVCQLPFGIIMTGIGLISLAGVVVNNAIVLLDYTRQLQRKGMEVLEASIEAGETRLRPVLLTAGTTIIGLIPMATGFSFDFHTFSWATRSQSSQWWKNMSIAVIFGLGLATLLTLVVVPALYVSLYRIVERLGLSGLNKDETAEAHEK